MAHTTSFLSGGYRDTSAETTRGSGTMTAAAAGRLTDEPAWRTLVDHCRDVRPRHLRELFKGDPDRGERLTLEAAGIYLDYSKNRITKDTLPLLVRLAEDR